MSSDSSADQTGTELLQDEPISPAMRRTLQQCFQRGTALATGDKEKQDRTYANTMLIQCVVNDPGNLIYVESFLDNVQQMHNNKKGGKVSGRGPFKKAVSKKDWRNVLRLGPEVLKGNPWDIPTLRGMAEACEQYGYHDVELRYLRIALDANPKDADVNRHCGRSLARVGQFDQAIACWHRVEEINKKDKEATKMVSLLSEDKARVAAGLAPKSVPQTKHRVKKDDAASSEKASVSNETQANTDEPHKRREIPLTPRQILERAIAEYPGDIDKYVELTEILRSEKRFGDAERVLNKALDASGGALNVRELLEEVQIERARQQVAIAEKRVEVERTEDAKNLVRKLADDLNRRELEVLGSRTEKYPDRVDLKYDLAVCLKRAGNFAEAVKYLLEAREDEGIKAKATLEMGACLQHQKRFAKALQCYVRAAEVATEDEDCKKTALYRAGVLAAAMKQFDDANKYLNELAGIDAGYKDVKARLDKIKEIGNKG